ncbi:MAG: hypothetical protein ACJAU5_000246 [Maricaulis maris]|jgi:hypothetical protein|nr:hypothetical protein [Maricaulis sp.]
MGGAGGTSHTEIYSVPLRVPSRNRLEEAVELCAAVQPMATPGQVMVNSTQPDELRPPHAPG